MRTIHARVENKSIVVRDETLPEGAEVTIRIPDAEDDEGFELSPEDEAELEDRMKAVERGEWIDGDDVLRRLRSRSA